MTLFPQGFISLIACLCRSLVVESGTAFILYTNVTSVAAVHFTKMNKNYIVNPYHLFSFAISEVS